MAGKNATFVVESHF